MTELLYLPMLVLHIVVCFLLVGIVLLQRGKGADLGAAFGGASQTVFGARGAESFLGKLTQIAAVVFMLTSLSLAYITSQNLRGSSLEKELTTDQPQATEQVQEAKPAAAAKEEKTESK